LAWQGTEVSPEWLPRYT